MILIISPKGDDSEVLDVFFLIFFIFKKSFIFDNYCWWRNRENEQKVLDRLEQKRVEKEKLKEELGQFYIL